MAENVSMIGYTRVLEADGSQVHDRQNDPLIAAGVDLEHKPGPPHRKTVNGPIADWQHAGLEAQKTVLTI